MPLGGSLAKSGYYVLVSPQYSHLPPPLSFTPWLPNSKASVLMLQNVSLILTDAVTVHNLTQRYLDRQIVKMAVQQVLHSQARLIGAVTKRLFDFIPSSSFVTCSQSNDYALNRWLNRLWVFFLTQPMMMRPWSSCPMLWCGRARALRAYYDRSQLLVSNVKQMPSLQKCYQCV